MKHIAFDIFNRPLLGPAQYSRDDLLAKLIGLGSGFDAASEIAADRRIQINNQSVELRLSIPSVLRYSRH